MRGQSICVVNTIPPPYRRFSPFPAGTLLVSWDVISMYPSIDNEVGLSSCKAALNRRGKLSPSTVCLPEAIKITLPPKPRHCNGTTQCL